VHVDNLSRQFSIMNVTYQTSYVFNIVSTCNTYVLILAWFMSTEYSAYRGRDEIYTVSGLYAAALTAILYVMVNMVIGGGRANPTLNSLG